MKRIAFWALLVILIWTYPVAAQLGTHALMRLFAHTYADLQMADMPDMTPALPDGQITYCSDCKAPATPGEKCAVGGKGAEAHRIRGQWSCY